MMEESGTQVKRGRGRPRKNVVAPVVNEASERLAMSDKEARTSTQEVQKPLTIESLTGDYIRLYGKAIEYAQGGRGRDLENVFSSFNLLNPFIQNQRLKAISDTPQTYDKETIIKALQAPQYNERALRSSSWGLSVTQYLYYKMLRESCDVPAFKWYKYPDLLDSEEEYSSKEFKVQDQLLDDWLEKFNIINTCRRVSLETKREGKACYMLRSSICQDGNTFRVNYATLQKMPSNFVKLTGIGERGYTFSFDMLLFAQPGFSPLQYCDYIQKVWMEMNDSGIVTGNEKAGYIFNPKKAFSHSLIIDNKEIKVSIEGGQTKQKGKGLATNTYMYWVEIPQEIGYVFASDLSHPWACPDTAGLFLNLQELTDYSTLAGLIASTQLTAVLTAEADYVDGAQAGRDQTKINPEILKGLQDTFNSMTSTNVEAFFAPLKNFELHSIPNQINSSEIKTKALQDFVISSGEGGIIVATDKPSIAQIKGAQALTAAQYDGVTKQIEAVLNFIVQEMLGLTYKWKIKIFGDNFSIENEKKFLKEMVSGGAQFFLPKLLACEDIGSLRDTKSIVTYIKSCDFYKELTTLTMEKQAVLGKTITNEEKKTSKQVGRPVDEDSQNDNTLASQETGLNISENKEQYAAICEICGSPIQEGRELCDECIKTYVSENEEG